MARSPVSAAPRPTRFCYFMSLRTGTFLVLLTQLVNKVTAFYGILALLTHYHLNAMQLSMYIYSILLLGFTIYLLPYIRQGSAWHCLAFAQTYALDTVINAVYTAGFTASWFMVLASHDNADRVPGGNTIGGTAGFTSPQMNVSSVNVLAAPADGAMAGQEAGFVGSGPGGASSGEGLAAAFTHSGSIMSLAIICVFWLMRGYAVAVVIAYARQVLRQHIATTGAVNYELHTGSSSGDYAENPFAANKEAGKGLKGMLGRVMVSIGRSYWLGKDAADQTWVHMMGNKFRKSLEEDGPAERERRHRSGTGAPEPERGLLSSV